MGKGDGEKEKKDKKDEEEIWGKRELAMKELEGGSTLDACILAEARLRMMQKEGNRDAWAELVWTVLLHLFATICQYTILIFFAGAKIERVASQYEASTLYPIKDHLQRAITDNNVTIALLKIHKLTSAAADAQPQDALAMCGANRSYPWIHRMLMMVWLAKMTPEIANCLWRMFRLWLADPTENHDAEARPAHALAVSKPGEKFMGDETEHSEYSLERHEKKPITEWCDAEKKKWTKKAKERTPWWDSDKIAKAWKDRLTLITKHGHAKKQEEFEEDTDSSDFPVRISLQEQEEVHEVGDFSIGWIVFVSLFGLIPSFFMLTYITIKGAQLIAMTGDLGRLIKTAIKLKFLLKVPETVFEGYASQDLKDYIESTSYVIQTAKKEQDLWNKWLSTATKLVAVGMLGFVVYTYGFYDVYRLRKLCHEFYEKFPETECLSASCTGLGQW